MVNSEKNASSLPPEAIEFVERIVRRSSWKRSIRQEVRRELLAHFEDGLENVAAKDRTETLRCMMHDFGQPDMLGKLIHNGKQRCRPVWEKAAWNFFKAVAALIVILFSIAWFAGHQAEIDVQATVARLREAGSIRDVSQLQSTRPHETVYFNGRDEDCATSLLLSLVNDPLLTDTVNKSFQWLPDMDTDKEQALRVFFSSHEEQLAQVRHLAELPPTSMEQVIRVTGIATSLENIRIPSVFVIEIERFSLLNAFLLHRAGHDDEALAECARTLSLARHMRDIPDLFCQLIANRIEKEVTDTLAPIALSATLSNNVARSFACGWDPDQNRAALAQSMEFEAGRTHWVIHDTKLPMSAVVGPDRFPWSKQILLQLFRTPFVRFLTAPEETTYYTLYGKLAACARQPFFEIRKQIDDHKAFEKQQEKESSVLVTVGIPRFSDLLRKYAFSETRMIEARTALALNQYKAEAGHYPETLDALIPNYLVALPVDPFSGQHLLYAVHGGKYLLYSVGANGLDDTPRNPGSIKNLKQIVYKDDIIWGLPSEP